MSLFSPLLQAVAHRPGTRIAATVFFNLLCYITVGLPLAVIPTFVHHTLGYDAVIAGLAVSIQYLATFASRASAGRLVDTAGPKRAVVYGLSGCACAGLVLLLSGLLASFPLASLLMLFVSRLLLGFAESWTSTGCITWAIGLVGSTRTAQVISFNGITSYGGIALGAPLGLALTHGNGLVPLGLLTIVLGATGMVLARRRPPVAAPTGGERLAFGRILLAVAPYGSLLALGSVGFGVIAAFVTLFYDAQGWRGTGLGGAGTALSVFGLAFVATRVAFAGLIGRFGGVPVAIASFVVETLGLLLLWGSASPLAALVGSALTGAGFSLVFPALGVLAVASVAPSNRGATLGAYTVFLDISIGLSGPLLGLLAKHRGYASLFLCAGLASLLAALLCVRLRRRHGVAQRAAERPPAPSTATAGLKR